MHSSLHSFLSICFFVFLFFCVVFTDGTFYFLVGYPQPEYRWMKDGQFQTEFSTEPVYKIQSIRREDAGVYQCVARNAVGAIFSDQVQVLVACKFHIKLHPPQLCCNAFDSILHFLCPKI